MERIRSLIKTLYRNNDGFTLIDLIVSITIMGLVTLFTFAAYSVFNHYYIQRIDQMESQKIKSSLVKLTESRLLMMTDATISNNGLKVYQYNELMLTVDSVLTFKNERFFGPHHVLFVSDSMFKVEVEGDTLGFWLNVIGD